MDPAHTAAILLGRKAAEVDLEALQRSEGDRLLAEIVDQRVRLRAVRDMALAHGQGALGYVLMAEASIRSCLEFEARLLAPILAQRLQAKDTVARIERIIIEPVAPKPRPEPAEAPAGAGAPSNSVEVLPPESPPVTEPPRLICDNIIRRPLFGRYSRGGE